MELETKYIWEYENESPIEVKGYWMEGKVIPYVNWFTEKMFVVEGSSDSGEYDGKYYDDEVFDSIDAAILERKTELNSRLMEITNSVAAFYEKYPSA